MLPESESNLVLGLASPDAETQHRAAMAVLDRAREVEPEGLPLHQRTTKVLAESWRSVRSPRTEVITTLARAMVDESTDLLVVNVLGHTLAAAGEDGVTELLPLLSHPVFWVRAYAADGIGALDNGSRWAVPALRRALNGAAPDWTAFTIIRALGNIGGNEALALLEHLGAQERNVGSPNQDLLQVLEEALAAARSQA